MASYPSIASDKLNGFSFCLTLTINVTLSTAEKLFVVCYPSKASENNLDGFSFDFTFTFHCLTVWMAEKQSV